MSDRDENSHFLQRVIQESVPGKQITLAHIIANPDKMLFKKLNIDIGTNSSKSAIGVITICPAETTIILADIAVKSSTVVLEFVDRIRGSLIMTGSVSDVESAVQAIMDYVNGKLGFTICEITRT